MVLKKNIMNFITSWRVSKTGQSLLLIAVILAFAACRREDTKLDLDTKGQDFQIGSYFTDTITVNASTTYVRDSVGHFMMTCLATYGIRRLHKFV
jgi:hypothetical protein